MEMINREINDSRGVTVSQRDNIKIGLKVSLFWVLIFVGFNGLSQASLDKLIINTKEKNKTLIAANHLYSAEVAIARTGNSPSNPEVEYAYLWGTPDALGERVDFAVTQSFDFPTAYSSRSKLSKIKRSQASLRLEATEQEVIVNTRQAWIVAVYLNKKKSLLSERLRYAKLIDEALQRFSK